MKIISGFNVLGAAFVIGTFAVLIFEPVALAEPNSLSTESQSAKLAVGDSRVSGSHLRPCTNLWIMTKQKVGGPAEKLGTWSDSLEMTDYQGKPAMKRTQIAKYDKKDIQLTFVSIFDPATMEPFSFDYSRTDNGNVRHVEFKGETVNYRHTESTGAKPEEAVVKLDRRVFDFYGGMYGMLVSAVPLVEGYTAEIPAFDTTKTAIDWVPVRVKRYETVEAGPGKKWTRSSSKRRPNSTDE